MRRISSRWTRFYKRLFPLIWFGALGVAALSVVLTHQQPNGPPLAVLLAPMALALFGYLLMRKLVFDLVDEVWDDGDELIAKQGGIECRIALGNVINVGYSLFSRPERITLTLREPSQLGREVTFMPVARFNFLRRSPIADELIERADRARRSGA